MAAYVVFTREHTRNSDELAVYAQKAAAAREGHDVIPLVRYGAYEVLEGSAHEGAVILKFPDMQSAKAWYESPAYQDAREHRLKGADYRVFIAEGVD